MQLLTFSAILHVADMIFGSFSPKKRSENIFYFAFQDLILYKLHGKKSNWDFYNAIRLGSNNILMSFP